MFCLICCYKEEIFYKTFPIAHVYGDVCIVKRKTCYNNKMRILYVITSTDVGGAEQALVSLAKSLVKKHTVRVVCLKPLGPLAQELLSSGIQVISLQMTGAGLGTVSKLVREIETFKPDVVHAMLFRAIEFTRLACAGRHIKLITTPHFDLSKKSYWARSVDRLLKKLDTVSCAESISTYRFLLTKQHYTKAQTELVQNDVKKSLFFKDNFIKSRMREEKKFSESQVVFICVARLAKIKNHQVLLRAFWRIVPSCPNARLVLVGEGPERETLEKFIKTHQLQEKVMLAGEQKNINDWLNMVDVFVLVSTEESLPLSLLEAQQVGLPCIVSQAGDMPARVLHGKNGFVCKANDETLLSCLMTEMYDNITLRHTMEEKTLCLAGNQQDNVKQYEQIYKRVFQ